MVPVSSSITPRPLPEIVGALLARGGRAVTAESLAGWRNDPDITAHLAGLASLDLGRADIVANPAPSQIDVEQWTAENNLAHLLEYTTRLKTLHIQLDNGLYVHFGIADVSLICSHRSSDKSEDHALLTDDACVGQVRRRPQSCSTASAS